MRQLKLCSHLMYLHVYSSFVLLLILPAEVLVWFDAGCSCSYSFYEEDGAPEVCAQILFVGGTESVTTSDYNVTVSSDFSPATADSEPI